MPDTPPVTTGPNFAAAQVGDLAGLNRYSFHFAPMNVDVPGKLFLKQLLGLTGCEISITKLPAGVAVPFYHTHTRNEEVYLFLRGVGEYQVDGEVIPVREGTIIRVAPAGERVVRNTGDGDLDYVAIQAVAGSYGERHTTQDGVGVPRAVRWPKTTL